jgi:hypothetical protein
MKKFLCEFFVVTLTSIYRVNCERGAFATKTDLKGKSEIAVGENLKGGTMLAICDSLIAYTPNDLMPAGRNILEAGSEWGEHTSAIVALFLTGKEAKACFAEAELHHSDPRWKKQTKEVLQAIGDEHPYIFVCHDLGWRLIKE